MKLTPFGIVRFWARLMFPPGAGRHLQERLSLKGDPPWEPWLHCAVWVSVWAILVIGLPLEALDLYWVALGLASPAAGFFSVWVLASETTKGWMRYVAMWTRMAADVSLAVTIVLYQVARWAEHGHPVMANVVMGFSAWYMLTLVVRDVQLIIAVERLAKVLHRDAGASVEAWEIVNLVRPISDSPPPADSTVFLDLLRLRKISR